MHWRNGISKSTPVVILIAVVEFFRVYKTIIWTQEAIGCLCCRNLHFEIDEMSSSIEGHTKGKISKSGLKLN